MTNEQVIDAATMDKMDTNTTHKSLKKACKDLAHVPPGKINHLSSVLWDISINYYEDVKSQAFLSFRAALALAVAGTVILFWAIKLLMDNQVQGSQLTLLAGVIIQVISGIIFYLYSRTSKQLFTFHACLERSNRFLLANNLCENIRGDVSDEMRKELIRLIATAPLLSQKLLRDGEQFDPKQNMTSEEPNAALQFVDSVERGDPLL